MKKISPFCWLFTLLLFLGACATVEDDKNTAMVYYGWSAQELAAHPTVITCDNVEQVLPMPPTDTLLLFRSLFEQGYFVCGYSLPQADGKAGVMRQAKALGACLVYFAQNPQTMEACYVVKLDARNYGIMTNNTESGQMSVVAGLRSGGPGESAGLELGDIIVKINGCQVFAPKTLELRYGVENILEIIRNGQPMTLKMWLDPIY